MLRIETCCKRITDRERQRTRPMPTHGLQSLRWLTGFNRFEALWNMHS